MDINKDYYKILNISKQADLRQIKKAYRNLALTYHPDRVEEPEKETAEKKFQEIVDAYYILADRQKRRVYDQYVGSSSYKHNQKQERPANTQASEEEIAEKIRKFFEEKGFSEYSSEQRRHYDKEMFKMKEHDPYTGFFGLGVMGKMTATFSALIYYLVRKLFIIKDTELSFQYVVMTKGNDDLIFVFFFLMYFYIIHHIDDDTFVPLTILMFWFLFVVNFVLLVGFGGSEAFFRGN